MKERILKTARFHADFYSRDFQTKNAPKKILGKKLEI
jgi:hypothetical protein